MQFIRTKCLILKIIQECKIINLPLFLWFRLTQQRTPCVKLIYFTALGKLNPGFSLTLNLRLVQVLRDSGFSLKEG